MITLDSQPQCKFPQETLNKMYANCDFRSWINLSMTCHELRETTYVGISQRCEEAYDIYMSRKASFYKYFKENFETNCIETVLSIGSVAIPALEGKLASALYASIPDDCPTKTYTFYDPEDHEDRTVTEPDHPNYPAAQGHSLIAMVTTVFGIITQASNLMHKYQSYNANYKVPIYLHIIFPNFGKWKYKQLNKVRCFNATDNHGHKFDYQKIRVYIKECQRLSPGKPVVCPQSRHVIELATILFDKKEFDKCRLMRKQNKHGIQYNQFQPKNCIIKEIFTCSTAQLHSLGSNIAGWATYISRASLSVIPSFCLTRK